MVRTGIFGGSFNPIHIGHLALANYLCEFEGLDEVWFMVTPQNPFKQHHRLWPDDFRLKLVRRAVEDYPRFFASDFEFRLPKPTYTVHTLELLRRSYPDREFHLIIGSDNWLVFDKWREWERIISENRVIVYPRPGYPADPEGALPDHVRMVRSPMFEVSSTFIREALSSGKDVRYFLHPAVWEELQASPFFGRE